MKPRKIMEIKARLSTGAVAGLAILSAVTIILIYSASADPRTAALGIEARFYSNIVGSFVGWIWMTIGMFIQMYSAKKNDPILASSVFAVGLGLVFTFNAIVVGDSTISLVLRVLGYMILSMAAVGTGFYLHYFAPQQRQKISEA